MIAQPLRPHWAEPATTEAQHSRARPSLAVGRALTRRPSTGEGREPWQRDSSGVSTAAGQTGSRRPRQDPSAAAAATARDLAGRIKLVKVNLDEAPRLAQRFNVRAVPTLLILRKGEMAAQHPGALLPPALRTWVECTCL
jgi:hypothetical protein